jgi:hypothetical protein
MVTKPEGKLMDMPKTRLEEIPRQPDIQENVSKPQVFPMADPIANRLTNSKGKPQEKLVDISKSSLEEIPSPLRTQENLSKQILLPVPNQRPYVRIIATPSRGAASLRVHFISQTVGFQGRLKFSWSFGDGSESDVPEPPEHIYGVGRFNVILAVSDENGREDQASVTIYSLCKG